MLDRHRTQVNNCQLMRIRPVECSGIEHKCVAFQMRLGSVSMPITNKIILARCGCLVEFSKIVAVQECDVFTVELDLSETVMARQTGVSDCMLQECLISVDIAKDKMCRPFSKLMHDDRRSDISAMDDRFEFMVSEYFCCSGGVLQIAMCIADDTNFHCLDFDLD